MNTLLSADSLFVSLSNDILEIVTVHSLKKCHVEKEKRYHIVFATFTIILLRNPLKLR